MFKEVSKVLLFVGLVAAFLFSGLQVAQASKSCVFQNHQCVSVSCGGSCALQGSTTCVCVD